MRKWINIFFLMGFIISSCTPDMSPPLIPVDEKKMLKGTKELPAFADTLLEGVYKVKPGADEFGGKTVIKKSGQYFSVFCGKSISYFILSSGEKQGTIYFEGYWRFAQNSATGSMSLSLTPENGALDILNRKVPTKILLTGTYNIDGQSRKISLEYEKPINKSTDFFIISHRGGGRNVDRLPVSENSLEMINYCQRLGANGIEIDLKLTKDGVPVLFHDEYLNKRLINEDYFIGKISDYTYPQLKTFVTLKNGETIPTLEDALRTVVRNTSLKLVWLDVKDPALMPIIAPIQKKYMDDAKGRNRKLDILIGIPDEGILNAYLKLADYRNYPALCELDSSLLQKSSAVVWAPRWSLGLQTSRVQSFHAEGKKAFVWTLDVPDFIHTFVTEGQFDGILTNYPTQVAFEYYVK